MLKRLHVKNWRSLRDVEINNLTPLTVLVGANSSGKSNTLASLSFLRRLLVNKTTEETLTFRASPQTLSDQAQREETRISGVDNDEEMLIDFSVLVPKLWEFELAFNNDSDIPIRESLKREALKDEEGAQEDYSQEAYDFIAHRWQFLSENFMPIIDLPVEEETDIYHIDPDARNALLMLDFMQRNHPDVYEDIMEDFRWLLGHVDQVVLKRDEHAIRLLIQETTAQETARISTGTLRLLAILIAYYALDMRNDEQSGLVIIEEPDRAVHPLLLKRFVKLLRSYSENEKRPRQFILTTHNPLLLNHFNPEEVRIVERDEQGYTHIHPLAKDVLKNWSDEYGIGDIWTTRLLGGTPE